MALVQLHRVAYSTGISCFATNSLVLLTPLLSIGTRFDSDSASQFFQGGYDGAAEFSRWPSQLDLLSAI